MTGPALDPLALALGATIPADVTAPEWRSILAAYRERQRRRQLEVPTVPRDVLPAPPQTPLPPFPTTRPPTIGRAAPRDAAVRLAERLAAEDIATAARLGTASKLPAEIQAGGGLEQGTLGPGPSAADPRVHLRDFYDPTLARGVIGLGRHGGAAFEAAVARPLLGTPAGEPSTSPYGRGVSTLERLESEGLYKPGTPETVGALIGSLPAYGVAEGAIAGPVSRGLYRRLAARGTAPVARAALSGAAHTALTVGPGAGLQTTTEEVARGTPVPEALNRGLEAGLEAIDPRHPLNAAFYAGGVVGGIAKTLGRFKEANYTERLATLRAERDARARGEPFQPPLPAEGPDRLRDLSDAELEALGSRPPPERPATPPASPHIDIGEAPPSVIPPSAPLPPRREIRLPAGAPEMLGSGPLLGGGRANLAAGTAGAVAGYTQGDTPEEKLLGALTGATVGSGIVESLRRRRGGRLASGPIVPHEPAPLAPDVSGFRSRMRDAVTSAPFARGTAEQWRAHLGKGVNQAELKDTGLGAFLDTHKGQVLDRDAVLVAGQPTPVTEVRLGPVEARVDPETLLQRTGQPVTRRVLRNFVGRADVRLFGEPGVSPLLEQAHALAGRAAGAADDAAAQALVQAAPRDVRQVLANGIGGRLGLPPGHSGVAEPRYAEYTLPGGQNYREVVLTTPAKALPPISVGEEVGTPSGPIGRVEVVEPNGYVRVRVPGGGLTSVHGPSLIRQAGLDAPAKFTSSHWPGVENPVAHLRLTDRQTPDGQKMTFLEEIQSDVHEQGREKGYHGDATHFEVVPDPHDPAKARVRDTRTGQLRPTLYSTPEVAQRAIASGLEGGGGVPRLPFSRTEDWVGLTVRRALAEAVATGADRLGWTTGVQQAQRYSQQLQRGLSGVRWDPEEGVLQFRRQGDRFWSTYGSAGEDDLAGVVGRQIADRLLAQTEGQRAPPEPGQRRVTLETLGRASREMTDRSAAARVREALAELRAEIAGGDVDPIHDVHRGNVLDMFQDEIGQEAAEDLWLRASHRAAPATTEWRTVEGADLTIGATGMRTFYDEIVPRVVTDYLKKLGVKDVKPEQTPLASGTTNSLRTPFTREEMDRAEASARSAGEEDIANVIDYLGSGRETMTVGHVREMLQEPMRGSVLERLRATRGASAPTVWSIPITPDLKAKVQSGEGTYLYSGLDPTLLKKLPPAAVGAAAGAGLGASQGKDTKERIALGLAGAAVGAVGGRAVSEALRRRRATAGAERGAAAVLPVTEPPPEQAPAAPERPLRLVPNEPTAGAPAAQPGGLPVEPPVRPTDYVNPAKFDLDPTGRTRLDAEVERLVTETGLHPKTVVTHAEVRRAASDLGVDIDAGDQQVNRRISGAKLLAIRNIVSANIARQEQLAHELAEPTTLSAERRTEVTRQLGALDAQNSNLLGEFVRARTAAGRELNALKIVAHRSLDPAVWWTKAQQVAGRDLTAEELVTIRRLVEERDRAGLVQMVSRLRTSTVSEQLTTLWKAGLLTNPKTHAVNTVGNTAMAALETAKDPVAAGFDWLLSLRTQQRTKGGLSRFLMAASAKGIRDGLAEAKEVLKGRLVGSQLERGQLPRETTIDLPGLPKSANALLDGYQRWVYRLLGASDQVFVNLALQRSLVEQAQLAGRRMGMRGVQLRDYVAGIQRGEGPLADVISAQAVKDANVATFHDVTRLGKAAASFARELPGGQFIVPFQKTPGAVATRVLEYSPLGFGKGVVDAVKVGLAGKQAPAALQRLAAEELGRGATGSGVIALGYWLAHYDLMTGAAPTMGGEDRQQWTQEGRRPNALRVKGQWVEVGRLSPLGNLLALGANLRKALEQPKQADLAGRAAEVAFSGLRTVADQPFVTGASAALAALQDPEREASRFAQGLAGSVVPAVVGAAARGTDVARVPELEGAGPFSGVAGAIAERIPGVRRVLPAKRTSFGTRVPSRGLVNAMFSPVTASPDLRADPVIAELSEADYAVPRLPRYPGEGAQTYSQRQRLYGVATRAAIEQALASPAYQAARQAEMDAVASARAAATDPRLSRFSFEQLRDAALAALTEQRGTNTRAELLAQAVARVRRSLKAQVRP